MAKKPNKENTSGAKQVIYFTRKQVLQMAEMVNHFKGIENFELHISHESGIGPSMAFRFELDLVSGDKCPITGDITDVSTW